MSEQHAVLEAAFNLAAAYRRGLADRQCRPDKSYREMLDLFNEPLPETGLDEVAVISDLAQRGEQGLTQMAHPRFFGWVLGSSAPTGVAADWLVSAWGQNAAFHESSPTGAAVEEIAGRWLVEILDLPRDASVGFVTGGTVGNFTALAAARGAVLRRYGWDPDSDGLFAAPQITIYLGEDAHTSVYSALGYLGLGRKRVQKVQTDGEGRMIASDLARRIGETAGPAIIIAQAGQINTGAFDPFTEVVDISRSADAWLHVDGAFGLWARAHPDYRYLTDGVDGADSWSVDGHKWLQTPFDSGYAIVRDLDALQKAMSTNASYLPPQGANDRVPCFLVPELSRRARGIPTWAMFKSLGRSGIEEIVARHCQIARRIADRLATTSGVRILNEVVLNQIVVAFGDCHMTNEDCSVATEAVTRALRESGAIFVGSGNWRGDVVMRLSVTSGATTTEDADKVVDIILSTWKALRGL
ncbi:MAG: pyridoxal phosphate-dependent decarboxylase family protein [Hyphomicrobiaceae bacterium]